MKCLNSANPAGNANNKAKDEPKKTATKSKAKK